MDSSISCVAQTSLQRKTESRQFLVSFPDLAFGETLYSLNDLNNDDMMIVSFKNGILFPFTTIMPQSVSTKIVVGEGVGLGVVPIVGVKSGPMAVVFWAIWHKSGFSGHVPHANKLKFFEFRSRRQKQTWNDVSQIPRPKTSFNPIS